MQFGDYKELSFPARRRKVFQFARTAGQDAIPTLRAIVLDDELERGFLVKYAAAKALAVQLGDQLGYLVLKSLHPDLVVKRPEISRELRIIQGQAHIRERNYEAAIEEFAKILETSPFDFEGNYHIAFAYLLLKNYPKAIHHFEIARRVRPRDQLTLYNLACAYSLHGDLDDAVRTLDEAVEAGFVDVDHMKGDHDLDPIREHPGFRISCARRTSGARRACRRTETDVGSIALANRRIGCRRRVGMISFAGSLRAPAIARRERTAEPHTGSRGTPGSGRLP